jgi:hypothetical protein
VTDFGRTSPGNPRVFCVNTGVGADFHGFVQKACVFVTSV